MTTKWCVNGVVLLMVALFLLRIEAGHAATNTPERSSTLFQDSFKVDLERYAGLWYEFARTPNRFQDNTPRRHGTRYSACFNATAFYKIGSNGTLHVVNRCIRDAQSATPYEDEAKGIAEPVAGSENRRLNVRLGPFPARLVQSLLANRRGNYWIYCLGERDGHEPYPWAVIGNEEKTYTFILTRSKSVSDGLRDTILECAERSGLPVDTLIFRQRPIHNEHNQG